MINQAKQIAFDLAMDAIIKQGVAGFDFGEGMCLYRIVDPTHGELRCAIGHMIPDAVMDAHFDDIDGWGCTYMLSNVEPVARAIHNTIGLNYDDLSTQEHALISTFLQGVQMAHDNAAMYVNAVPTSSFVGEFKNRMREIANDNNLEWKYD